MRRVVPLAEEAAQAVTDWLEFRPDHRGHDYLFTTARGNRIYPSRMRRILRAILEGSGVRREGISLHTLRHSAATLLLQTGTCDIVQMQRLLGHSRLDTTAVYLHVDESDLRQAMERHPLGGVVLRTGWRAAKEPRAAARRVELRVPSGGECAVHAGGGAGVGGAVAKAFLLDAAAQRAGVRAPPPPWTSTSASPAFSCTRYRVSPAQ